MPTGPLRVPHPYPAGSAPSTCEHMYPHNKRKCRRRQTNKKIRIEILSLSSTDFFLYCSEILAFLSVGFSVGRA